jgi:hypothetical protein
MKTDLTVRKVAGAASRGQAHGRTEPLRRRFEEMPSRPQRSGSSRDPKAKYRQIKVDIGFREKVQKKYIVKVPDSVPPTLTAAFALSPDLNSPAVKVVTTASETATEVQLTVGDRKHLHQLAMTCTNLRNLHQKIFCRKPIGEDAPPGVFRREHNLNGASSSITACKNFPLKGDMPPAVKPLRELCGLVVNAIPFFRPIQSYSDLFRLIFA